MWCPKFNCILYQEQYLHESSALPRLLLRGCIAFPWKKGPRIFTSWIQNPTSQSGLLIWEQNTNWKFSLLGPWSSWKLQELGDVHRSEAWDSSLQAKNCGTPPLPHLFLPLHYIPLPGHSSQIPGPLSCLSLRNRRSLWLLSLCSIWSNFKSNTLTRPSCFKQFPSQGWRSQGIWLL